MSLTLYLAKKLSASDKTTLKTNEDFAFVSPENDLQFDNRGRLITLQGVDKLKQEVIKLLLTSIGTSLSNLDYGSNLAELTVGKKIDANIIAGIGQEVINAMNLYNSFQTDNDNADEIIDTLDDVLLTQNEFDPRQIKVTVQMTTLAGSQVDLGVSVQ